MRNELIGTEQTHDVEPKWVVKSYHNFLIQTCSLCKKKMELVEGTTIYGEKWYHHSCWKSVEKEVVYNNV